MYEKELPTHNAHISLGLKPLPTPAWPQPSGLPGSHRPLATWSCLRQEDASGVSCCEASCKYSFVGIHLLPTLALLLC